MANPNRTTDDYSIGGGELYIATKDGSAMGDFQYFGSTTDVSMSVNKEYIEHENTEGSETTIDKKVPTKTQVTLSFSTQDMKKEVLAWAFGGEVTPTTQTAGSIASMVIEVTKGKIYELGNVSISNVVVTNEAEDTTYIEGTDYTVKSNYGTIEIANDGSILDGNIKVSYDYSDATSSTITAFKYPQIEAKMMFLSSPQAGSAEKTLFHKVTLAMNGDYALKSQEFRSITFECEVLKDSTKNDGEQFFVTTQF